MSGAIKILPTSQCEGLLPSAVHCKERFRMPPPKSIWPRQHVKSMSGHQMSIQKNTEEKEVETAPLVCRKQSSIWGQSTGKSPVTSHTNKGPQHGALVELSGYCSRSSLLERKLRSLYSSPCLSVGDTFQGPQWMPKTVDNPKPYIAPCFSLPGTYIPMITFNF